MVQVTNLGAAEAQIAIRAVHDELLKMGRTAEIAVADAHGELIALLRLDGAPLPSILNAQNKAWTAARERKSSGEIGDAARDRNRGFDIGYFGDPRYTGWAGGV